MSDLEKQILKKSFVYQYWFSRFEYTLKYRGYLQTKEKGEQAKPSWEQFRNAYTDKYKPSECAKKLVELSPKRQIIGDDGEANQWQEASIDHCRKFLCKVIVMLQTVRNNLFHGGKHYSQSQEDKKRDLELITTSIAVIKEIAYIDKTFEPYLGFDVEAQLCSES